MKSLLIRLAERVQELWQQIQAARPQERTKLYVLYREAYLAHKTHKAFLGEQDVLLSATA